MSGRDIPLKYSHDDCEIIRQCLREFAKEQENEETRKELLICATFSDDIISDAFASAIDASPTVQRIIRDYVKELERRKGAGHA